MDKHNSISVVYDTDKEGKALQTRQFRKLYVGHDKKFGIYHLHTTRIHKWLSPVRLGK